MARPLRMELPGGRFHITARGNERKIIFREDRDRVHFLSLLGELTGRYGTLLHGYVLMDNHYHLLVETPEANLSRAMQWLNVSYSVWFNRRHQRYGHLLQGRFKAVLIEDLHGLQEVARYVHLNPMRVQRLGLGKSRRQALATGAAQKVSDQMLRARLEQLRAYRWSSYQALAGYVKAPDWLRLQPVRGLCGGRTEAQQVKALRQYTEDALKEREFECPWEKLWAGMVLGTEQFARELLRKLKPNRREQPQAAQVERSLSWEQIVQAVERGKGERWEKFCRRHGDWGRDAALWLGRHAGRMGLGELAQQVGCDYTTVGKAVSRFGQRLTQDKGLAKWIEQLKQAIPNVKFEI